MVEKSRLAASERSRRLLFLLPFPPRLDAAHGGSRAMAQLLAALLPRHRLALLYLRGFGEPPLDETLRAGVEIAEEVVRPSADPSLPRRFARNARVLGALAERRPTWVADWDCAAYGQRLRALSQRWCPDIVQVEYHVMAQYLPALDGCRAPRVLRQYEPGGRAAPYLKGLPASLGHAVHVLDRRAWRRFERAIIRQVQAVVAFTDRDRAAVEQLGAETPVLTIPIGTVVPAHPLDPLGARPASILFVGSFRHPPNVEAALRLARGIFPALHREAPELSLYIVGEEPPSELRRADGAGIVITGRVPDLAPYLDRASLVVAPLYSGGGMRVKVIEALAAGKAVVATRLAAEGLEIRDGEQVAFAETDQEFVARIVELLADDERRASLAARARSWACLHLGSEMMVAAYENLYCRLLSGLPA